LANVGLALMVLGLCTRVHGWQFAATELAVGGSISALGAWSFAWNIWQTMNRTVVPPPRPVHTRPLPVDS
jgi:hypothetical protein